MTSQDEKELSFTIMEWGTNPTNKHVGYRGLPGPDINEALAGRRVEQTLVTKTILWRKYDCVATRREDDE